MTTIESGTFHPDEQKRTPDDFRSLNLSEPLLRAVSTEGYTQPTPIQAQAIPHILDGRDVFGAAQTGTGKTAAFALPIIQRLSGRKLSGKRQIRALILSPTRELALQIEESFQVYGKHSGLKSAVIYGGVSQNQQTRSLQWGIDILVATPGRFLDLLQQGHIDSRSLEIFVLDEADRMMDMGFINDVRRIVASLPADRQNLMFSATMPDEIRRLAATILKDPITVQVSPTSARAEQIEQSVYYVDKAGKPDLLHSILVDSEVSRALVFTRTKHGADRLARHLQRKGIRADSIHGNKTQGARQRALENFRSKATPVLVATDLAARGLDIDEISHVVNFDLPMEPETYVHRIGRTARAGASGIALSFCDFEERVRLFAIERLMRECIPVMKDGIRQPAEPHNSPERARYAPPPVYQTRRPRRPVRRSR